MNNIYLFVAPSGAGKTKITSELVKRYGLKNLQSYTTRPKRQENEYGHIFITEDEFNKLEDMVAYTYYKGNHYCATSKQVEENDLYVIDVDGVFYFKQKYKGSKGIKIIAINAPKEIRELRMEIRGDSNEQIQQRLAIDEVVFKQLSEIADVVFDNIDLDTTVSDIYQYICQQEKG